MAISDDLPGVEVAITVNDNDLKEYRDSDLEEEQGTTTRYIEAVSGQSFAIRIKASRRVNFAADTLRFDIYIDGKAVDSPLIFKERARFTGYETIRRGCQVSSHSLRRFEFAGLETVRDGRMQHGETVRLKDLGTITVQVAHTRRIGMSSAFSPHENQFESVGIVSEKALKGQAISHSIRLGGLQYEVPHQTWTTEHVGDSREPDATFLFRYRSIENLKSELIIPRTPTPPPLEDRDVDTLTPAELRELQRRARAFRDEQESKIKIKREKVEADERSKRRKIARPNASSTVLEMDERGGFRAASTPTVAPNDEEPIVLD